MIDFGLIEKVETFAGQTILAIKLTNPESLKLHIGQKVLIDGTIEVTVKGWKFWPENKVIDILIDESALAISKGSFVSIEA